MQVENPLTKNVVLMKLTSGEEIIGRMIKRLTSRDNTLLYIERPYSISMVQTEMGFTYLMREWPLGRASNSSFPISASHVIAMNCNDWSDDENENIVDARFIETYVSKCAYEYASTNITDEANTANIPTHEILTKYLN